MRRDIQQQLPVIVLRVFDHIIQQKVQHLSQSLPPEPQRQQVFSAHGQMPQGEAFPALQDLLQRPGVAPVLEGVGTAGGAQGGLGPVAAQTAPS